MLIKNCYSCKHLEYIMGEAWDGEGYVCNNRDYRNANEENKHLKQLEDKNYLSRSKKCWEQKNPNTEI